MVLYEDLNCPFCYALSEELEANGLTRHLAWRGIQHAMRAAIPWTEPGTSLAAMIMNEVETVRRRLPELVIRCPSGQPNTGYASYAVADAMQRNEAIGHRLRRSIKWALFRENRDISNRALIDTLRTGLGLSHQLDVQNLKPTVTAWQTTWAEFEPRMIPMIVTSSGERRAGLGTPSDAIAFVRAQIAKQPKPI